MTSLNRGPVTVRKPTIGFWFSALKRSIMPVTFSPRPILIPYSTLKSTMWTFLVRFAFTGSISTDSLPALGKATLVFRPQL